MTTHQRHANTTCRVSGCSESGTIAPPFRLSLRTLLTVTLSGQTFISSAQVWLLSSKALVICDYFTKWEKLTRARVAIRGQPGQLSPLMETIT